MIPKYLQSWNKAFRLLWISAQSRKASKIVWICPAIQIFQRRSISPFACLGYFYRFAFMQQCHCAYTFFETMDAIADFRPISFLLIILLLRVSLWIILNYWKIIRLRVYWNILQKCDNSQYLSKTLFVVVKCMKIRRLYTVPLRIIKSNMIWLLALAGCGEGTVR